MSGLRAHPVAVPFKHLDSYRPWVRPRAAYLDFSAAGGGAVFHTTSETRIWRVFAEMRETPESGYQPRLPLEPEPDAGNYRFFYCKVAGYYCKGKVSMPRIDERAVGRRVTAGITIWLNPNGDRSVEADNPY